MASDEKALELVGAIYDCVLAPRGWPSALERIASLVGGINASISVQDPIENLARFSTTWGVPEGSMALYNERYAKLNPVMTSGWYCDVDEPISAARYTGTEAYFASRYAREFLHPLGWGDAIGSHLMKVSNRYGILAIFGSWDRGAFGDEDLASIRRISPHVRRAVTIADLLDQRALQQDMLSATFDLLSVGIFLVDGDARIAQANQAGMAHLESRVALRRDGDRLSARDPKAAHELRDAIIAATRAKSFEMPRTGIAVPIAAADRRDLAAWVMPLDGGVCREFAAPFAAKAAVFVRELGDTSAFAGELFVKRYGITPAECRVLMMLAQGMSIAETCDALGVTQPTVKTHLSRLFAKTGTGGQSELMRLACSALSPSTARQA